MTDKLQQEFEAEDPLLTCWSCKKTFPTSLYLEEDGNCPSCGNEMPEEE